MFQNEMPLQIPDILSLPEIHLTSCLLLDYDRMQNLCHRLQMYVQKPELCELPDFRTDDWYQFSIHLMSF